MHYTKPIEIDRAWSVYVGLYDPPYLMRHGPFLVHLVFANEKACLIIYYKYQVTIGVHRRLLTAASIRLRSGVRGSEWKKSDFSRKKLKLFPNVSKFSLF